MHWDDRWRLLFPFLTCFLFLFTIDPAKRSGLGLDLDLDGRSSAHGSDATADGEDFLVELKGVCVSAAGCLDRRRLLEYGDKDFFRGEISLPAAAEATLRRVVIANERRMLRCLLLLLGVVDSVGLDDSDL